MEVDDGLALPDFLDRRGKPKLPEKKSRHHRAKPQRPKGAKWSKAELRIIVLHDEAPRIGSGVRHVWALVGRQWVQLARSDGSRKTKISMALWRLINGR